MRAYIVANHEGNPIPPVLLPHNGHSILNYVIDEVLLQKQINQVCIILPQDNRAELIKKHLSIAYPSVPFAFAESIPHDPDEHMVLDGSVYTTLRLQDLIRYYQQYKTITYAAYDKTNPKQIPFTVYPEESRRDPTNTHTYNCGTGTFFSLLLASQ